MGGTFHLKLNTNSSPIANKYREGKVQSTLERESNVPETAVRQAYETCARPGDWLYLGERKRFGVIQSDGSAASPGICQHGLLRGEASFDVLPSGDIWRYRPCGDCNVRA